MKRVEQGILIVTFLAFSWLAMQAVHELGHVLGAWITGATVTKVALHPAIISRTDLGVNPRPLVVVWAGPILGATVPLLTFVVAKLRGAPGGYLFRFFAGFCLISNGVYIALGPADGAADTGVMMQYGSPRWIMALFGLLTAPLGLYLLHKQGPHFGLGEAKGKVSRHAVVVSAALLLALVALELIVNHSWGQ